MENNQTNISVKDLTEEITLLIKNEIVATYADEENALKMRFLNGQSFLISIQEIKQFNPPIRNQNGSIKILWQKVKD